MPSPRSARWHSFVAFRWSWNSERRHHPRHGRASDGASGSRLSWSHQIGGLHLLPGVIAGTNEGSRFDMLEAHRESFAAKHRELVWRDVAVERNVIGGRAQILPERENVDVDGAKIPHRREHLFDRLAHPQDDAGLRRDVRRI